MPITEQEYQQARAQQREARSKLPPQYLAELAKTKGPTQQQLEAAAETNQSEILPPL